MSLEFVSFSGTSNFGLSAQVFRPFGNLGEDIDVLSFLANLISNRIIDPVSGTPVLAVTTYPREMILGANTGRPIIYIQQTTQEAKWISIPAVRQRWYAKLIIGIWAYSISQRYAIEVQIRNLLNVLIAPIAKQLARNYVFMQFTGDAVRDNVQTLGTVLYIKNLHVEIIYDILNPPPAVVSPQ
jgi:hypothetical protein